MIYDFENFARQSTFDTILGHLNNIAKYCNVEGECTCVDPSSQVYSFPFSEHIVFNKDVESTEQDPIDAIRCIDDLNLKVSSFDYDETMYSTFLENIETNTFASQNCKYAEQNTTTNLNKPFILGYGSQYAIDYRTNICGTGFVPTPPCFDFFPGQITSTIFDLTYCNTPSGYLSTISPKGLKINQHLRVAADNPRLRVWQGIYLWNHQYSYWFGGTCGFVDGDCLNQNLTDPTCSPCMHKLHPYQEINSSYKCTGESLYPPACSSFLKCPPFEEGAVNWTYYLNPNCFDAKEFVRPSDGNVKVLSLTYSNISDTSYDISYNRITAKPYLNENYFPICSSISDCPECTITIEFRTYVVTDRLIVFFDNDGDNVLNEEIDEVIYDTGYISTGNEYNSYKFDFAINPDTNQYPIDKLCNLQICVIGNQNPSTIWDIIISGCHFDPPYVASGSSEGICVLPTGDTDGEYNTPEINISDGQLPSGVIVYPEENSNDSGIPEVIGQNITCFYCNPISVSCEGISLLVDLGETCEDYGFYSNSGECSAECVDDGGGTGSGSGSGSII